MTTSTTFVSALLTNINGYRSIEKYVECGKKLIALPINKVIFIERDVYDEHFSTSENTTFVFIEKSDLYLHKYADQITDFSPKTGNPDKDTLEYMFVQCNKTEWMRLAIEMNPYISKGPKELYNNFVWIDFGIWHMIRDDQVFTDSCMNISQTQMEGVRIASGDPNYINNPECYKTILWFFLGSIFGGDRDSLLKFADLVKNKCIQTIQEHGTIMWEINVWLLVYKDNPTLFKCYRASHDASILQNY
jgi:hypothetical protein